MPVSYQNDGDHYSSLHYRAAMSFQQCPRYLDSRGLKTKIKNSWNGYLSGSHTKLSRRRTELKLNNYYYTYYYYWVYVITRLVTCHMSIAVKRDKSLAQLPKLG